jgi:hypothetical protein
MNKTNKIFSFIYLAIGVVAIVFSILCLSADEYFSMGSYEANLTYGGDAYTGMQNAAAQAANNIISVNENLETLFMGIQTCFGYALMIVGALVVCSAVKGIVVKNEEKTASDIPTATAAVFTQAVKNETMVEGD